MILFQVLRRQLEENRLEGSLSRLRLAKLWLMQLREE